MSSNPAPASPIPSPGHWIAGQNESSGTGALELRSPVDGTALGRLPLADAEVVEAAVQSGARAFAAWSRVPVKERVLVLYKFREIALARLNELA
ncbi:MAG: putative methylmalonate-semialdehyde dehydrogenase, partial [Verrucomicrobiales bacterium]|nr:putative methylmalonate-semialdehyde dehydrogenase [Verrucomicrobiales bacterium]